MSENSLNILSDIAYKNKHYLNNDIDHDCRHTIEAVWSDINILKENVPEVIEGFGLGFPFHSLNSNGELVVNPEFSDYSNSFMNKVKLAKNLGQEAWQCFQCQRDDRYSPNQCKTCDQTVVKPRDVMKVMPDIDIFLIADDTSKATLDKIQATANEYSFHQSDKDSYDTIRRIGTSFRNIKRGMGPINFPCDMHVISCNDFINSMSALSVGQLDVSPEVHSLHYDWVINNKIDLAFDMIFSSTFNEQTCNSEILEIVRQTRYDIANIFSNSDIIDIVESKSKRAKKLLSYNPTKQLFIDKIESWRNSNDRFTHAH